MYSARNLVTQRGYSPRLPAFLPNAVALTDRFQLFFKESAHYD